MGKSDHRFNLSTVYWSNLADGMCINKLYAMAVSSIVEIEVPHLRVSKALFLCVRPGRTDFRIPVKAVVQLSRWSK